MHGDFGYIPVVWYDGLELPQSLMVQLESWMLYSCDSYQRSTFDTFNRIDKKPWEVDHFTLCFRRVAFRAFGSCQKCINVYHNINVKNLTELIKSCEKLIILPCIFEGWLSERSDRIKNV